MIDDPAQVETLMQRMSNVLPLPAFATSRLLATLRDGGGAATLTSPCTVTKIDYAGDGGGIVCHLAFKEATGSEVFIASITHLHVDRPPQVAREIAAYQKRRTKRLRREQAFGSAYTQIP
jgi:hypothetical protein